ncbi:hypothetical protein [Paenibacillus lentus]|uniref:hypothetical protein n=1 Tax=Paenibacillus lentus TaxID=1338368 RepID=UPI001B86E9E7|nr:hypothetical protein [Paenibacillus lentus]
MEASGNLDPKLMKWVEWAKAKADWYDPTIAREDEFFGIAIMKRTRIRRTVTNGGEGQEEQSKRTISRFACFVFIEIVFQKFVFFTELYF